MFTRLKKLIAPLLIFAAVAAPVYAQGISNPVLKSIFEATPVTPQCSNKSFEAGTTDWQLYSGRTTGAFGGSYASGVVPTSGCAEGTYGASCHLVESTALDYNISSLAKVVHGGQSLRIGGNQLNSSTGYTIQGASKRFFVEAGKELYKFRFASVMQQAHDVTHGYTGIEPYFEAIAIDAATGTVIDSTLQPSSGYNLNTFPDPDGKRNRYIPWTCAQLDLTGYVGKEVIVYITSADCNAGGHSSYSYIDDTCADCEVKEEPEASIDIDPQPAQCGANGDVTVTGTYDIPAGFDPYTPSNVMVTLDAYSNNLYLSTITSGTATGGTYSFSVPRSALPDTGCIDVVATLTFNITTPSGVTRTETVTTPVDGQTAGTNNDICVDGDTCGPNCAPFTQEGAQCDASTGATIITLTNTALPNFDPNDVRIVSKTPGVTVSQNPANPLELAVTGGTPGQVIKITTEAIDKNGGDGKGIDLCCMGEMTITIPADQVCEGPVDVSVNKVWQDFIDFTGMDTGSASVPPHGFVISVDLPVGTLQPGDVVTVTDPSADQMNVTGFGAPIAPAPWTCTQTGGDWSCSYVVPSTGPVLPVDIVWSAIIDAEQHVKNCAYVDITRGGQTVTETTLANNQSCWEENPNSDDPDLDIVKSGPLQCQSGQPCVFTYTVTNSGTGDYNGAITLDDTVTQTPLSGQTSFGASGGHFVSISPALCAVDDLTSGVGCTGSVSIPAGGSETFTVTYNPPVFSGEGDFGIENCVELLDETMSPGEAAKQSCHLTEIGKPQLEIVKTGPSECPIGQPCDFTITITNTSQTGYSGPVMLSDTTNVSQFAVSNVSPMPVGCGGNLPANPFICVTDMTLAAGASTSYTVSMMPLQTGGQVVAESGENCARLGALPAGTPTGGSSFSFFGAGGLAMGPSLADLMQNTAPIGESCVPLVVTDPPVESNPDITVTKTCDPLQVFPAAPDVVQCQLTITGTNLTPGSTVTISDELFSQASPGNNEAKPVTTFLGQSNISSSEPWVCYDTSASAPYSAGTCQISADALIAAGGTSVISTSSQIIAGGGLTGDLQNCAQAGGSVSAFGATYAPVDPNTASCVWLSADCGDGYEQQNGECVPVVSTPPAEYPEFNVFKECGPITQTAGGQYPLTMDCVIKVQPLVPFAGQFTINDVATNLSGGGSGAITSTSIASDPAVTCNAPTGAQMSCVADGPSYPTDSQGNPTEVTIPVTMGFSDTGAPITWQNCAGGTYTFDTGTQMQVSDYCVSQSYTPPAACTPVPEIAGNGIDDDCDGETDEVNQTSLPQVTLEKTSTGKCAVNVAAQNYRCGFQLDVSNTSTTAFSAPMVLNDTFGAPKPSAIRGIDGEGWDCTTKGRDGSSCINGTLTLNPGETSSVAMNLTLPGQRTGGTFENCAAIGVGDDPLQQAMIAQTALNQIGFDVGAVDGKIGPKTREGLKGLQKQLGLEETGEVSDDFFRAIGLQMAADATPSCVTVDLPPMPEPPLVCQAATATKKGNACVCRYRNMYQKNKTSCGCVKGTKFVKGEGCRKVVAPKCDRTTTVAKGNSCQCRYANMYKKSNKLSCGCVKGTKFVKGEGCIKPKVKDKPKCPFGSVNVGGLCIKIKIPLGGGGDSCDVPGAC